MVSPVEEPCLPVTFASPKVENFGVTAPGDKNVRWLDVAMYDAFAMCPIEPIRDFDSERQCVFRLQGTPGDTMLQSHAVEELHHHEGTSIFFTDVVNRADVGMVQR